MKKLISLLTATALLLSMAACGGEQTAVSTEPQSAASESAQSFGAAVSDSPAPALPEATTQPMEDSAISSEVSMQEAAEGSTLDAPSEPTGGKTLIAVFSRSGNTAAIADMIQTFTGGDLFTVTPAEPYPEDYDTVVSQAKEEQRQQARPAVANTVADWDSYSTVFVGYPIWWDDAPMVVRTFLESYDWSGKELIPFCTSGGSGFGSSLSSLAASAPNAELLEGFHVLGSQASSAEPDVQRWLSDLGFSHTA